MARDLSGEADRARPKLDTFRQRFVATDRCALAVPLTASGLFFGLLMLALYPGVYSPDSVVMLSEGTGKIPMNNWHPVLLAELWGVLATITGSNTGVWIAQSLLAAVCAFGLLRQVRRRVAIVVAVVFLMLPPLWGALAMTWKDTQLALIWFLVAVAMVRPTARRGWAALLLVGVVGITITRYNSFGLAIGPAWLASTVFIPAGGGRSYRTTALRVGATGLALAVALSISIGLGGISVEDEVHPEEALYVFDIVGIGVRTGDVDLRAEAEASPPCTFDQLSAQYRPDTAAYLIFGPEACVNIGLPTPDDGVQHVFRGDWTGAIAAHPWAYARHRTRAALITAGVTKQPLGAVITTGDPAAERLVSADLLSRPQRMIEFLDWFPQHLGVLYRPVLWVFAAAIAVATAGRRRQRLTIVLGSTVVNLFIVCASTPAAQVRYSYPALITMIVAIVISLDDRRQTTTPRPSVAYVEGDDAATLPDRT